MTTKTRGIELINNILDSTLATKLVARKSDGDKIFTIEKEYYEDEMRREILQILEAKNLGGETDETIVT